MEGLIRTPKESKPSEGALTNWRPQRPGLVRTRKENGRARGAHFLETVEGATCQDTKRKQESEGYSLPGDHRMSDLSGHFKEVSKQGALTF